MKWPRASVWKCSAKAALTAAPPIAPRIGAAWAATFSLTTTPKRAAICEISRTTTGAERAATPWRDKAGAVADRLGERRADGEIAALERRLFLPLPPRANTSTQAKAASGTLRSSPSSRAISAIERRRMVVESGSSSGSAASPNAPPTAPGRGGGELMGAVGGLCGAVQIDRAQRELERASERRLAHMRDHLAGPAAGRFRLSTPTGRPTASVSRWAKLVPSRQATARLSSSVSSASAAPA